jgi:hypothetical protein
VEQENGIFGLDIAEVLPIVEAAAGVPIAALAVERRNVEGGVSGSGKQLCLFRYTTRAGSVGEETLFVKRCVWKGRSEAVHYRHLAAAGVPTPRLYGALPNDSGEEIIFLERLSRIGFRLDSVVEWRHLLSLMARFNACVITPDYAPHLHRFEQVGVMDGGLWITGVDASPTDEELAASLRSCDVEERELPGLQKAARAVFAQVAAQPRGLLHQDFFSDNLGWRGEEMLVFDVQKHAVGPRFADVAPYLGLLDWSARAAFLDTTEKGTVSRRESLTRHYLEDYARFGGGTVALQTFQEEARALFWAHKVSTLSWLVEGNHQARVREVLDFLRHAPSGR